MRFVDEKGKLFGLINPIDLGVIVLLLFIGIKVFSDYLPKPLDKNETTVTVGLLVRDIPSYLADSITIGQDLFLKGSHVYLGKIRVKKTEPAELFLPVNGEMTVTRAPRNLDLRLELRRQGKLVTGPRAGVYLGRYAIRIGDRISAQTLYTSIRGEVESLHMGKTASKLPAGAGSND